MFDNLLQFIHDNDIHSGYRVTLSEAYCNEIIDWLDSSRILMMNTDYDGNESTVIKWRADKVLTGVTMFGVPIRYQDGQIYDFGMEEYNAQST